MNIWEWMNDWADGVSERQDFQRGRLLQLMEQIEGILETAPDGALAGCAEAIGLAARLDEPCWRLYFEHLRTKIYLAILGDFERGLAEAVRNALEARKPQYAGFPIHGWVQTYLICAWVGVDAEGYAAEIEAALGYLQEHQSGLSEDRWLVLITEANYALERGQLDRAEAAAWAAIHLDHPGFDPGMRVFYVLDGYTMLCDVARQRKDYAALAGLAAEGEEAARACSRRGPQAEFQLWQALALREAGRHDEARRLWRRAQRRLRQLQSTPRGLLFDTMHEWYAGVGKLTEAVRCRRWQLRTLQRRGQWAQEARAHLALCQLLAAQGKLGDEDLGAAREAARNLSDPSACLRMLDRIA